MAVLLMVLMLMTLLVLLVTVMVPHVEVVTEADHRDVADDDHVGTCENRVCSEQFCWFHVCNQRCIGLVSWMK